MFKIHICRYLNGHETFTMSSIFPRVAYVSLVLHFCMAASSGVAAVTVQGIRSRTVGEYVAIMKAMHTSASQVDIAERVILNERESISVCPGYATAYFDFPAQDKYDFVDAILSSDTNCFVELRKRLLNVTSSQIPESAVLAFIRLGLVDKFNERFKGGMVPKIKDERIETGVSNLVYTSIFAMSQAMSENVSNGELGFSALLIDANKCRIVASSFDGRLLLAWHRQSSDCYLVGVDFVCYRNFLHSPVKFYFYVPGYGIFRSGVQFALAAKNLSPPNRNCFMDLPHKILKSPLPLSNSTLQLISPTQKLKQPNTQKPKHRMRMFRRGFSFSVCATKPRRQRGNLI